MNTAENICRYVKPDIRPQAETLARAVLTLQEKIENEIGGYKEMPLAQVLTTTQGEKALKVNPATQEFRATVRDYASALNNLNSILDKNATVPESSSLADLRKRFRLEKTGTN